MSGLNTKQLPGEAISNGRLAIKIPELDNLENGIIGLMRSFATALAPKVI